MAQEDRYVLIVEDSPDVAAKMAAVFDGAGIVYKIAKDSREAIMISQSAAPALIVLDLMLPGMNGFKLAQLLRADSMLKSVPIIVVSALYTARDKELAKTVGVNEYFNKPIDDKKLLETISKYVKK